MYAYMESYTRQSYRMTIDTANRTLTLYKDGKVFKSYSVGVGKLTNMLPPTLYNDYMNAVLRTYRKRFNFQTNFERLMHAIV